MEFFTAFAFVLATASVILSIIALARISGISEEMKGLRRIVDRCSIQTASLLEQVRETGKTDQSTAPPEERPTAVPPPPLPPLLSDPSWQKSAPSPISPDRANAPIPEPVFSRTIEPPASSPPDRKMEVEIGGKWAAFAGIATLVTGIVFFVGYAIQHNWIGPGLRVILGLLSGAILVGLGYTAETRSRRLHILAQSLTGGGAALFYFSVFAAYGIYHLITAPLSIAGLAASAAAALGLAVVYDSQAVAILALLGAYLTPALIGAEFDRGMFPLVFIAGVNVPVLVLGLKRKWQWLYNLAFWFTVLLASIWLARELPGLESKNWLTGLIFVLLYFAEFVALGLIKLEQSPPDHRPADADVFRLAANSLALLGAVYWIFESAQLSNWTGTAFLVLALLHAGLARLGWSWRPSCRDEILALLIGALTFASLALPIQLDGAWVSLGWAIEGALLAWFALRIGSVPLQIGAMGLGLLGLAKSAFFDFTLYPTPPTLFLNSRFGAGLISAALLGVQGYLHSRSEKAKDQTELQEDLPLSQILACAAVLGLLLAIFADGLFIRGPQDPWMWAMTTMAMVVVAAAISITVVPQSNKALWGLGLFLLAMVPIKLLLVDSMAPWPLYSTQFHAFGNLVVWLQLLNLLIVMLVIARLSALGTFGPKAGFTAGQLIHTLSLSSGIVLVTLEIHRSHNPWGQSLITLWWAVCALTLAVTGIVRHRAYLRYMALLVFGLTVMKVFFVDMADLTGLHRVAAFVGLGVLLLILSYAYQRVAPWLMGKAPEDEP